MYNNDYNPLESSELVEDEIHTSHHQWNQRNGNLSRLHPTNNIHPSDFDMLGFATLTTTIIGIIHLAPYTCKRAIHSIDNIHTYHQITQECHSNIPLKNSLSPSQIKALNIVLLHFQIQEIPSIKNVV